MGWYFFFGYMAIDVVATLWLFNKRKQLKKIALEQIDFPMWVNDASDDIDSKFNNIVRRMNHPVYHKYGHDHKNQQ
jgi:hypothetical protein